MVTTQNKLSLWNAILVNINIMLGSGIFINTVLLAKNAGALSFFVYLLVGVLIFPLIYSMAYLLKINNGGTFYDFGKNIHPFMGFISSWSYFTAKMASSVLGIHVFVTLIQKLFPNLESLPTISCEIGIIFLFIWLNSFNLKMGSSIQFSFIFLKMIPLLFAIISGLFLFNRAYFNLEVFNWSGIPVSMPLVIFAFSGFEASCSLSSSIENPEKNGPRAIFISYTIVLILAVLYQLMFYGILGSHLSELNGFAEAFPSLLSCINFSSNSKQIVLALLHIGIASSALGSSYGIIYSNSWNLYTLAKNDHIAFKDIFIKLNKNQVPFVCVLAEGFLALIYLIITRAEQVPLQQISALGSTIAYTLSMIALALTLKKQKLSIPGLVFCSLISCFMFIASLLYAFYCKGTYSLIIFSTIFVFGIVQFFHVFNNKKKLNI